MIASDRAEPGLSRGAAFPLIRHDRRDTVFAFRGTVAISAGRFLAEVAALAATLPAHRHVVNLCTDRYRFAVGLVAALCRGQLSLLPPTDKPGVLAQLASDFPDLYCLTDGPLPEPGIAALRYPERLEPKAEASLPPMLPAGQPAVALFTSGSTGRPTAHVKSWGTLVRSARAAGEALGVAALSGATVAGTVPHQHSYGLESTVLLPLQHGLALQAERPFYPADIAACLERVPPPRLLVTTPIHLRALVAEARSLPRADLLISATAPLARDLAAAAEAAFAAPLLEIYGCSEAGQLAVRRTVETTEWQCLPGVVLRRDAGGSWAGGEPVESETLLNDVLELRGSGRFLLGGRTADLVNIAGKRTSLAYLNHQLMAIAGVRDGAFVMPEDDGERVARLAALVVAPGMSGAAILDGLRRLIDAAFLPRPLIFADALPRNAMGKLPRDAVLRLLPKSAGPASVWHVRRIAFAADHPTAPGHFPGNPIIPGAVLLDEAVSAIAGGDPGAFSLGAAKFLAPVRPGDAVLLRWSCQGPAIRFEAMLDGSDRVVLTGNLRVKDAP